MATRTVDAAIELRDMEDGRVFAASFSYDPADPFAVQVTFMDCGHRVEWLLYRDVLQAGFHSPVPVGAGDVRFGPSWDSAYLALTLTGQDPNGWRHPDGSWPEVSAVLLVARDPLRQFLQRTYELVPIGKERFDADGFIASCLDGAS